MQIKNKRWKLIISATFGFTIVIIFFDLLPRYSALLNQAAARFDKRNSAGSLVKNQEKLRLLRIENQNLRRNINNIVTDYKENKNLSSVLTFLDEKAAESYIKLRDIKPGELKRQNNLWLQPIELNLNSNYENIYNYLRFLEGSNNVILITELSMKPANRSNDSLNIKAHLEVYLNL